MSRDQIHGGPQPAGIRHRAGEQARRSLLDNKTAIVWAELVAEGVQKGIRRSGGSSVDASLLNGNTRSAAVNIQGKFVITPKNPTPAQTASAALLAQANFQPGLNPPWPSTEIYGSEYQVGVIVGAGNTVNAGISTPEIIIIDELGITTYSEEAEYELVWLLALGSIQAGQTAPPNTGAMMIPSRRGWPFGTADNPAELNGMSRLAPVGGLMRQQSNVILHVEHTGVNTPAYVPSVHYVEITMRGWTVRIGDDSKPISTGLGGITHDPQGMP